MKKRLYISNDEAGFFDNNKMLCLDNPPTQGDFIVGDIVISNKQEKGVFGWVCVLAGSPGRWEVINDLRYIQEAIEQIEQSQDDIVNGDLSTIKKQIIQMAEQALILDREHKDELDRLNSKVSTNTNNILNINNDLKNINKDLSNMKESAGDLQGDFNNIVNEFNTQIELNNKNIENNTNRIIANESRINNMAEQIEQCEEQISKNTEMIEIVGNNNGEKNNQTLVSEFIGVARSYYKARVNEKLENVFIYDATSTPFDTAYDPNGEKNNAIDCSTFIGLILRGIPFKESPYSKLLENPGILDEEDSDKGNEEGNDDEHDDIYEGTIWNPLDLKANPKYSWAINPMDWKLKKNLKKEEIYPVRTASQLAQWMYERGWSIPLDPTFANVEPGDIIFWAKKVNGEYRQPNRYMCISHAALCVSKYDRPVDDENFPAEYPLKHTMYEVTTKAPYVLNRTLEKCSPGSVVMICRPDLGSLTAGDYVGNLNSKDGIDNLSDVLRPGFYYTTSAITKGLPEGITDGKYMALKVERSMTRLGKVYSLVQTLINTRKPDTVYVRTQYCYSHEPDNVSWTDWLAFKPNVEYEKIINEILAKLEIDIKNINQSIKILDEKIGNTSGGTSTGIATLHHLQNIVVLDKDADSVEIGIALFNKEHDILTVHKNSVHLIEHVDYEINEAGDKIVNINNEWDWLAGDEFVFEVLKNDFLMENSLPGSVLIDQTVTKEKLELGVQDSIDEIENIKKGLAGALVSNGINADIGMTWKELFELLINNLGSPGGGVNPIIPGELILYKNGVVNDGTEFNDITIDTSYLSDECIELTISKNGAILWFGYNGKIDFSRYENAIIEIKNVAEHASLIGIGRFDNVGCGYDVGTSEFNKTFVKGKTEVVIEEGSRVVHTLPFADLYTENDKEGYFGIYIRRVAGTGGSVNDDISIISITVIPKPLVPCTGLSLDKTEISLTVGGQPITLVANVSPADCTDKVVWKSTNTAIATVDSNGVVTPKAPGSCVIRATCGDITVGASVVVTSNNKDCTSIRFTESSLKIHVDQVTDLKEILVIQPDGCTDPVEWVADNTILEINNGVIKGLAVGSTKVQARCGGLSANINITVVSKIPEDLGEGILLYRAGTEYNTTEFRNLCKPTSLLENALCYDLNVSRSHVWFSYDGYINFDDYDRVEITAYTEKSTQQPLLGLAVTSDSGQYGHAGNSNWTGAPHTNVTLMYNVTETKYTLPINYTGPGYLLLWMNHGSTALGKVYITEIRVIPKKTNDPIEIVDDEITIQVGERYDATRLYRLQEGYNVQYKYTSIIAIEDDHTIVGKEVGTTELEIVCGGLIKTVTIHVVEPTDGIVLFDNGEHYRTEFGDVLYPSSYVSNVGDIDFDLTTNFCTYAAICYNGHVNFNNYEAIAITVHTENTQQTDTLLMVGRGTNTTLMLGSGTSPYTISYDESTFSKMTNTKNQATYVFNFEDLRKQDVDTGYLGICIKRGNADGHVYIDKIVVYRDGEGP